MIDVCISAHRQIYTQIDTKTQLEHMSTDSAPPTHPHNQSSKCPLAGDCPRATARKNSHRRRSVRWLRRRSKSRQSVSLRHATMGPLRQAAKTAAQHAAVSSSVSRHIDIQAGEEAASHNGQAIETDRQTDRQSTDRQHRLRLTNTIDDFGAYRGLVSDCPLYSPPSPRLPLPPYRSTAASVVLFALT